MLFNLLHQALQVTCNDKNCNQLYAQRIVELNSDSTESTLKETARLHIVVLILFTSPLKTRDDHRASDQAMN